MKIISSKKGESEERRVWAKGRMFMPAWNKRGGRGNGNKGEEKGCKREIWGKWSVCKEIIGNIGIIRKFKKNKILRKLRNNKEFGIKRKYG